jgi:hypothetical protein
MPPIIKNPAQGRDEADSLQNQRRRQDGFQTLWRFVPRRIQCRCAWSVDSLASQMHMAAKPIAKTPTLEAIKLVAP